MLAELFAREVGRSRNQRSSASRGRGRGEGPAAEEKQPDRAVGDGSPRTGRRRGEKQVKKENERGAECRLAGADKSRGRQSRCVWIWVTAPGKIMESALLAGEVAWGAWKAGLGGAILLRAAEGFSDSGFHGSFTVPCTRLVCRTSMGSFVPGNTQYLTDSKYS